MKLWLKILLFFLLYSISPELKALSADTTGISSHKLLRLAKRDMAFGLYEDAVFYYDIYYGRHQNNIDFAYMLAELHRKLGHFEKAAELYAVVAGKTKQFYVTNTLDLIKYHRKYVTVSDYPLALYYEALMLKGLGNYDESISVFKFFINTHDHDDSIRNYIQKAKEEITGCTLAIKLMLQPNVTQPLPLNDKIHHHIRDSFQSSIFSPAILKDSSILYFEMRMGSFSHLARPYCSLRKASVRRSQWYDIGPINDHINNSDYLMDGGCFSADRKTFYFTRTNLKEYDASGKTLFGYTVDNITMYSVSYNDGKWGIPYRLGDNINLAGSVNIMPGLSIDKKGNDVMYFASDRPGGCGGYDIWKAVKRKNSREFYEPVNLGPVINTPYDEITPFMDEDSNKLYFSTNGRPGFGGFDIFCSKYDTGWQEPVNLGVPYNTGYDERYYCISPQHDYGFFTRSFASFAECMPRLLFDHMMPEWIYSFELPVQRYAMKLHVVSGDTTYLRTAEVQIYSDKNGQPDALISSFSQEKGDLDWQTIYPKHTYHTKAFSQGYYPLDTVINTDTLTHSDTFNYVLHLQPKPKDTPIVIKNIFFRFNEDELTADSKKVLDTTLLKYMQKNPTVKIMILSHTDSIGTAEYNLELSQKRAESIVRYLVNKGISPERLMAKGYGSKYPIAPNHNKDGTDNPEGRAENRRTEFRIIPNGRLHPEKN